MLCPEEGWVPLTAKKKAQMADPEAYPVEVVPDEEPPPP